MALIAGMSVACGGEGGGTLTELQHITSGSLEVVVLSERDALRQGKDTFVIEFRSVSDGALVDVGVVQARANMPMPGMAPMFGSVEVMGTDVVGRYAASSDFSMAGSWRTTIQWNGPAGQGSVTFANTVQ